MKKASKILVLGTACALLIAGLAIVLMGQDDASAVGAAAPVVAVQSCSSDVAEDEAVLVTANVNGEDVPLSGVRVTICKMNVTAEGEQLTFRIMEAITLRTGADGRAMYNFSEASKYMVCAENQEQKGFANMNMNQTEAGLCYTHQWNWANMSGQTFVHSCSGQGSDNDQSANAMQAMSGDTEQDRVMAQDCSCL